MSEATMAAPLPWRRRRRRPIGALVLLGLLGLGVLGGSIAAVMAAAGYDWPTWHRATMSREAPAANPADIGDLLDNQVMPISTGEAERLNALRPADLAAVPAAKPFAVADRFREAPAFASALQCLTQAIYYEAASESDTGQRAVAQVVLNRVRHPAFPDSVCGVVYQGSELATGCQFSFTCDGSLARQPSTAGWSRARRIALAALSGWVEPGVGLSTHYHASYVVPYWASSLDKVLTVGAHIFYTMRGGLGASRVFTARYDFAGEQIPATRLAQAAPPIELPHAGEPAAAPGPAAAATIPLLAEDRKAAENRPLAEGGRLNETPRAALRADERRGALSANAASSRLLID